LQFSLVEQSVSVGRNLPAVVLCSHQEECLVEVLEFVRRVSNHATCHHKDAALATCYECYEEQTDFMRSLLSNLALQAPQATALLIYF